MSKSTGHRQDGNVLRDTQNQIASKRLRAERAKCPKCERKGALITWSEPGINGLDIYTVCRWKERGLCDYAKVRTDV